MSREWKPGDVAMVTADNKRTPYRAYFDGKTWREAGCAAFCVDQPTSHRPLVVIDPEDTKDANRLPLCFGTLHRADGSAISMDEWQIALRSLVAPPKPDEPTGLGAVVEDAGGERFVRHGIHPGGLPWCNSIGVGRSWARVDAVKVLSEGVTP